MNRPKFFWAIVLIVIGTLLLFDQLGLFFFRWHLVWPFILIALGLLTIWEVSRQRQGLVIEQASVPLDHAERASIHVHHGAGKLRLSAGAAEGNLLEGTFAGGLDYAATQQGSLLDVRLQPKVRNGSPVMFPVVWGTGYALDWDVRLSRDVDLALLLEVGANESHYDLSALRVTDLKLKTGASSTHMIMPASAGYTRAHIESGAASINITIPAGVGANIRVKGGLSGISVDTSRFPQFGEVYQSVDYATATNKLELDIESGLGSISIK